MHVHFHTIDYGFMLYGPLSGSQNGVYPTPYQRASQSSVGSAGTSQND